MPAAQPHIGSLGKLAERLDEAVQAGSDSPADGMNSAQQRSTIGANQPEAAFVQDLAGKQQGVQPRRSLRVPKQTVVYNPSKQGPQLASRCSP